MISVRQFLAHSRRQKSQTPHHHLLLDFNDYLYVNTYIILIFESTKHEYYQKGPMQTHGYWLVFIYSAIAAGNYNGELASEKVHSKAYQLLPGIQKKIVE